MTALAVPEMGARTVRSRGISVDNLPMARASGCRSPVLGEGLGHALISEAFKIALRVADDVGCRCIITDAYRDRIEWYARYGFVPLEGTAETGPQRMFLDIRTLGHALKQARWSRR